MKRSLLLSVSVLLFPFISGAQQPKNAIHDPVFARGFNVVCPDPAADTVCGVLLVDSTATPVWTLRQYNSKFNIVRNIYENIGNRYHFRVPGNGNLLAKAVSVNPAKGTLTMECNASAEYKGIRRSEQPWISLTADTPTDTMPLSDCKGLRLSLAYRVLSFEDCMGFLADEKIHSATYRITLIMRNVRRESLSFGKQFRLCLRLFDNRYMGTPCYAGFEGNNPPLPGEFSYYPNSAMYIPNAKLPRVKQSVELNVELLPIVKEALDAAVADNLLPDAVAGDWEIVACDMGWEMKGTYNASIQVKKLQLTAR
ncbi:MAG: hypothetical protein IJS30_00650 [Bacteroidales bacterium]|nr:hypothetical protein [Bacteroidales bacterium]